MTARYFLSRDNDAHWYVIPVAKQQEWNDWCGIPDDDSRSWVPPLWACPVGGAASLVTFTNPQVH